MTIALILGLVLAVAAAVTVARDLRAAERKLQAERMRADAATDETRRLRSRVAIEKGRRDLAEVGYRDLLTEVEDMAAQMEASYGELVARRLHRLVGDRRSALRRAGL